MFSTVDQLVLESQLANLGQTQPSIRPDYSPGPATGGPGAAGMSIPVVPMRGGLRPKVLRRVREHIDAHLDRRISMEALANLAELSVCYFVRAFKQSTGVTPHDYLIRQRVERTMELLSGTDLPLSEIALVAGFADQSHCARRFRQHVGMSPREYRWSLT